MTTALGNPGLSNGGLTPGRLDAGRRCIFQQLSHCALSAEAVIQASIHCTAQSRNLPPQQASGCQPLGAWHCALGFRDCLPVLLGGDACLNHFNRFLEQQGYCLDGLPAGSAPSPAAAVPLYAIEAAFSTCLDNSQPVRWVPPHVRHSAQAKTPSFVGNHSHGWDTMFEALISALRPADQPLSQNHSINLVLGFEHFPENYRVMEQLLQAFGLKTQVLSDARLLLNAAAAPRISQQGTTLDNLRAAPGAIDTLLVRPWQLPRTQGFVQQHWGHGGTALPIPMGLAATDRWLAHLAKLTDTDIPPSIQQQRANLVDAMQQASPLLVDRRIALYGEPDFVMGTSRFLLELGVTPVIVLCQNGDRRWQDEMTALLRSKGEPDTPIVAGKALNNLKHWIGTRQPDLMIAPPDLHLDPGVAGNVKCPLRRVDLAQITSDQPAPSTLAFQGARHLLNRIMMTLAA